MNILTAVFWMFKGALVVILFVLILLFIVWVIKKIGILGIIEKMLTDIFS